MIQTLNMIFDRRNRGVIYLDLKLKIVQASDIAQSLFSTIDCISTRSNKIIACTAHDHQRLLQALKGALHNRDQHVLFLRSKYDKNPCRLDIYPILEKEVQFNKRQPSILVVINSTAKSHSFLDAEFQSFYGLTPSESSLVKSLQQGIRVADHAVCNETKVTTARWTLGNVFSKTETNSQAELRELAQIFTQ